LEGLSPVILHHLVIVIATESGILFLKNNRVLKVVCTSESGEPSLWVSHRQTRDLIFKVEIAVFWDVMPYSLKMFTDFRRNLLPLSSGYKDGKTEKKYNY
jgi:hypothetical protein